MSANSNRSGSLPVQAKKPMKIESQKGVGEESKLPDSSDLIDMAVYHRSKQEKLTEAEAKKKEYCCS